MFAVIKIGCIFVSAIKQITILKIKKMKVYNQFTDKFNNEYKFDNYMDFAKFWFNLSRKTAMSFFPTNFAKLQNAAANSKEARTKVYA
jgi:hypothetical protein